MLISFITTIKICKNYEWLLESLMFYVKNIDYYCKKYLIEYEILICEQIDKKNICRINDKCNFTGYNVSIIELNQNYDNPFNFNLIEAYGKNECLKYAIGEYTCMTSSDILFSENFFMFIKNNLQKEKFYRFATYEIPRYNFDINTQITEILTYCEKHNNKRLANGGCFVANPNACQLAQKSGDIMLLDTESFKKIKGWPETECFVHMDYATCIVATNNFKAIVPDKNICVYTFTQKNRESNTENRYVKIGNNTYSLENYQFMRAISYRDKLVSN